MHKEGKRDYLALENYIVETQRRNPKCELTNQIIAEGLGWSPAKVSQNLKLSRDKGRMIRRFKFLRRDGNRKSDKVVASRRDGT